MDKYKTAMNILESNYINHKSIKDDDYEFLINTFPEFMYENVCYRCLILKPSIDVNESLLLKKFCSWARTKQGIFQFLQNEDADKAWDLEDSVYIYQANVIGFDISELVKALVKLELIESHREKMFIEEDEIISYDVIELKFIDRFLFKDYYHLLK